MKVLRLFLLCMMVLVPALAFAVEVEADSAQIVTQGISHLLIDILIPALGAVIMAFVSAVILPKIAKKTDTEKAHAFNIAAEAAVWQGVAMAQEYSARIMKDKRVKIPGGEKMNMAVGHAMSSVPGLSRERASALVDSVLARTRGEGATGEEALYKD